MVDLNALIPPGSGMQLTLAETINDRGEIGVNGTHLAVRMFLLAGMPFC